MSSRLFRRGNAGAWYAQGFDAKGERWQRSTRQHDRRAAERVRLEWERAGGPPTEAAPVATLGDTLDAFIANRTELATAGTRSLATVEGYRHHAKPWRRSWGDGAALGTITAARIDAHVSARRAKGIAEHTLAKELTTLRAALKLAKRAGQWSGDTDALFPLRFSPNYEPRSRALSRVEVRALLAQLAPDRAAFVAFTVATGARLGEARRAERGDVAPDRSSVRLRGTKTKRVARIVPVVGAAAEFLAFALEHGAGEDGALCKPWRSPHGALADACERAKIGRVSPNDLRRTFATWLRAAGATVDLIAPAMGHADSAMVERVYGRLDPATLRALLTAATATANGKGAEPPGSTPGNSAAHVQRERPNFTARSTRRGALRVLRGRWQKNRNRGLLRSFCARCERKDLNLHGVTRWNLNAKRRERTRLTIAGRLRRFRR